MPQNGQVGTLFNHFSSHRKMDDVFGDGEIEAINDGDDLLAEDEVRRIPDYHCFVAAPLKTFYHFRR